MKTLAWVIAIAAMLIVGVLWARANSLYCETVGSKTPISEGMGIAEYVPSKKGWDGVPYTEFENKPYLMLIGPENGFYAIFQAVGGGVIVVPFEDLETGSDGWQHNTCGYLITWDP